jgi:hypothetical protein
MILGLRGSGGSSPEECLLAPVRRPAGDRVPNTVSLPSDRSKAQDWCLMAHIIRLQVGRIVNGWLEHNELSQGQLRQ